MKNKLARELLPDLFGPDPDPDEPECACGHTQSKHFSGGCTKCDCCFFVTWDEIDEARAALQADEGE